jgi:predicted amidohydrolase YtcJ
MSLNDSGSGDGVEVAGLVDHHTHLLKAAAGQPWPWQGGTVREFHERVWRDGGTPMDIGEPAISASPLELAERLRGGLAMAAGVGLVEVTEMGMRDWCYLDALAELSAHDALPARVRIYLASGLAEQVSTDELDARRADCGPWVRLDGIKFYADGWLGARTCALCGGFADTGQSGLLFTDAATLARRITPFAARGWRIATHAIGDLGVQTVLDAYELAWDHDQRAIAAAKPRIEHASVLSAGLIDRIAELGVWACIQPSFAVTDARQVPGALGDDRAAVAYPWARLATSGANMLIGTDYPIEVLDPLVGLARLVNGRSQRPGFGTDDSAPEQSRLPLDLAFRLGSDEAAGRTVLSAQPRADEPDWLDQIRVLNASPAPFRPAPPTACQRPGEEPGRP